MLVRMHTTRRFVQLTGVTVKALRHYEQIGLLAPKRTGACHRRYSLGDAHRLEQILALKSLGLPLDAIKRMLGGGDVPLSAHRQRLQAREAGTRHRRARAHRAASAAIGGD